MTFIKHPRDYDPKAPPIGLFEAMGEFLAEQTAKGVIVDAAGLQPLMQGTRIRLAGGSISVTDGPFAEAKEVVGGYAICELPTPEDAVALATRFMELHRIHWPGFEGEAEVRPLQDGGD